MKTASAKSKGRRVQNEMVALVCDTLGLSREDVRPAVMGEKGADLKLSSTARAVFPFAVEAKNQERISIWSALAQAEAHAKTLGLTPMLAFRRNRSRLWVAVPAEDILEIIRRAYQP